MAQEPGSAAFARTGTTNPLGKFTAEIPKFKVPEETKEILDSLAHEAGMTLTEFVRMICLVRAHGLNHILSLEQQRLSVVAGTGSEKGAD